MTRSFRLLGLLMAGGLAVSLAGVAGTTPPRPATLAVPLALPQPPATTPPTAGPEPAPASNPAVEPGKVRWHPSFAAAKTASARTGKPVLVFHMMGRLDRQFC